MSGNIIPMQTQNIQPIPPGVVMAWMPKQVPIPGCPPGLEYMCRLEEIWIEKINNVADSLVTGWDKSGKYALKNANGQQFFYAFENSNAFMRFVFRHQRGFSVYIVDNLNEILVKIYRPLKLNCGCGFCACLSPFGDRLVVESPPGQVIGYVSQNFGTCTSKSASFDILDAQGKPVLLVEGPCCICEGSCTCCCPKYVNEFIVMTIDRSTEIGRLGRKYYGYVSEAFTKADRYSINFPLDLDVKVKATLVGAMFLIDFMYFEDKVKDIKCKPHPR